MADQKLSPPCARPKTELPSGRTRPAKRAAIYTRVSCADQHPETQVYDLRGLALNSANMKSQKSTPM